MSPAQMAMTISTSSLHGLQHPDLAVRLEARQHPGGVVVVKQLAAELQIQLAAELGPRAVICSGLQLQVLVVVESDLHLRDPRYIKKLDSLYNILCPQKKRKSPNPVGKNSRTCPRFFWRNPLLRRRSEQGILKNTPLKEEHPCDFMLSGVKATSRSRPTAIFFETNDIDEAKDFAMRLAFDETNLVYVRDIQRDEIVRDFDAEVYR